MLLARSVEGLRGTIVLIVKGELEDHPRRGAPLYISRVILNLLREQSDR